jgi:hypothetical protein
VKAGKSSRSFSKVPTSRASRGFADASREVYWARSLGSPPPFAGPVGRTRVPEKRRRSRRRP